MQSKELDREYIESLTDKEIVEGILSLNERITKTFLYDKCYPMFKSRYDRYYTDCTNCIEFINQIYIHIMVPGPKSSKAPLKTFAYGCKFTNWLTIVTENYCRQLFKKKVDLVPDPNTFTGNKKPIEPADPDITSMDREDIKTILENMPNQRYRKLIYIRYLEGKSNEDTAKFLGIHMDNYYNVHKRAKEQFTGILKREGLL